MKKPNRSFIIRLLALMIIPLFFIACKKDSDDDLPDIPTEPAPVTDIDGNSYNTVKIGNQIWMAENLKASKLNDGSVLTNFDDYS